jgi:hypothetical protein
MTPPLVLCVVIGAVQAVRGFGADVPPPTRLPVVEESA